MSDPIKVWSLLEREQASISQPFSLVGINEAEDVTPPEPEEETQGGVLQFLWDYSLPGALSSAFNDVDQWEDQVQEDLETAGAFYRQNTWVGSASAYSMPGMIESMVNPEFRTVDPDFNPYRYYWDNKEQFADLDEFVRQGKFESVKNQAEFDLRVQKLRREAKDREAIMSGSTAGAILGMGLSFYDATTFVPFMGAGRTGKFTYDTAKMAGITGAYVAGHELGLHSMQDLRTQRESFLNIGVGTVIGGGLGAFGAALSPRSPINPRNPRNPLDINNENPVVIRRPGDSTLEGETVVVRNGEPVLLDANGNPIPKVTPNDNAPRTSSEASVGAAMDEGHKLQSRLRERYESAKAKPSNERDAGDWFAIAAHGTGRKLNGWAGPAGRALNVQSGVARDAYLKMMDIGGTLTNKMVKGQAVDNVAEDLKAFYFRHFEGLQTHHYDDVFRLNYELGGTSSELGFGVRRVAERASGFFADNTNLQTLRIRSNKINSDEYAEVVHKTLFDDLTPEYMDKLRTRFGNQENVDKILNAAKQQVNRIHESNLKLEDEMVRLGMLKDEHRMGKDYRMAQLWDPKMIIYNKEKARLFFKDVFAKDPTDEFLQSSYGMDAAEFARLRKTGKTTYKTSDGTPVSVEGPEALRLQEDILDDWAGTVRDSRIAELEARAAQLEADAKLYKEIALSAYHNTRTAESGYLRASLKEMKQDVLNHQARLKRMYAIREKAGLAEKQATLRLEQMQATRTPSRAKDVAKIEGQLQELSARRRSINRKIKRLETQTKRLDQSLADARKARMDAATARKEARSLRKEAVKLRDQSRKGAKKADKAAGKAQAKKRLEDYVEELLDSLSGATKIPLGVVDDFTLFESGRVKTRKIHLTPEQRKQAEELGILRSDTYGVLERQHNDVSARLAIRRAYNDDENLTNTLEAIRRDYDGLRGRAQSEGRDQRYMQGLSAEYKAIEQDLFGMRDRLLGIAGTPDNPDGMLYWLGRTARAYNFNRYGTGFGITSLTDMAIIPFALGRGILRKPQGAASLTKLYRKAWNTMHQLGDDEIRRIVLSGERVLQNSRAFALANAGDTVGRMGIGEIGTRKHAVTSAIDQGLQGMNEYVNILSGLRAWNTMHKAMAMTDQQHNLVRILQDYDELFSKANLGDRKAQLKVGQLASLGIGERQVKLIRKAMAKDGPIDEDGVWNLGINRWIAHGEEGEEAFRIVQSALRRAADRAVITPGVGDTPLLMSSAMGKFLMQFQTFGFVINHRFIAPLRQRVMEFGEIRDLEYVASIVAIGSFVAMAKDRLRGVNYLEKDTRTQIYDAIDRSGLFAYMSPLSGMAMRLLGESTSKYSFYSQWWQTALGPSAGTLTEFGQLAYRIREGEATDVMEKAVRLLPYSEMWRRTGHLLNALNE